MKTRSTFQNLMRLAAMMLLLAVVTTAAWAQIASTSDGWIITGSANNTCVIKGFDSQKDKKAIKIFPAIIDGKVVKRIDMDFGPFTELETIYMYEGYEGTAMPTTFGGFVWGGMPLKHVHVVDAEGNVKKSDELPASIMSIPEKGFNSTQIESLKMPNVTTIGDYAFSYCLFLKSIIAPALTNISENAFDCCTSLESFNIPTGVTSIEEMAFSDCVALKSINIPDGVTSIGDHAFCGCSSLTSITIPASVASIGKNAFGNGFLENVSGLTSATIYGNPSIGEGAFPAEASLTLNLTPMTIGDEKWMPFCNGYANFQADSKTTVYKATVIDGQLALTEVKDRIVNAGAHVLLKRKKDGNIVMTRTETASTDTHANTLEGTDTEMEMMTDALFDYYYDITISSEPSTGGAATASTYLAKKGTTVKLTATANVGYVFASWTGSGVAPVNLLKAETTFTMSNKPVNLVANFWDMNTPPEGTYELTLIDNTGALDEVGHVINGITSYELPSRTRDGYIFLGWATSATATIYELDPDLGAGKIITLTTDLTLYAIWLKTPVALADNADNSVVIAALINYGAAVDIVLQGRTLHKDRKWNTLCLPFDMTAEQVTNQLAPAALMTLRSADYDATTGVLTMNFTDATSIEAGGKYIIKWADDNDVTSPTFTGVTVSDIGGAYYVTGGKVKVAGTYSPVTFEAGSKNRLYIDDDNNFCWPKEASYTLNAFRAYFELSGIGVNELSAVANNVGLNFEGEATGILKVNDNETLRYENDNYWYSLDGRKLSEKPTAKGVYIHNGVKVVIR